MKAVCLLVFLALAHHSVGHIFNRHTHHHDMARNNVEYIDAQPEKTQSRSYETYYAHPRSAESRKVSIERQQTSEEQQPQWKLQQQQTYKQQPSYRQEQYRQQESSQESQEYQRQQQPKKYNSQKYLAAEYPTKQMRKLQQGQYQQEDSKMVQNYLRQDNLNNKQQKQRKYQSQDSQSQSYERTQESTSIENSYEKFQENQYAVPVSADTTLRRSTKQQYRKPVAGESIAWRNIQMATGPQAPVEKEDIEKIFSEAYNSMNHVSEEQKKIFHQAVEQATQADNEDAHLNATQLLNKYQYGVETHTIKTDDGYYLTLFRIAAKHQIPQSQRPVVFLMHGLLGSADDWLLMGPEKSLAYLLADAGYDVWLGNARGSKYARRHATKHPAQPEFWQYSTDDIALHDLPAMIDYVLQTSKQQKLQYVGYSQGNTAFFALAATRPEYNKKIIMMHALSPMVYMSNVRSPLLRMIAPSSRFSEPLQENLGKGEFKPSKELVRTVGGVMCQNEIGCKKICSNVNFVMAGVNVEDLDAMLVPVIMGHLPAGASTKQMKQYAQAVASQQFTKYDYGSEINQKVYGSSEPPKYKMQKVMAPVALYYSDADWLSSPQDVQRLANELPNVKASYQVPEKNFSHMNFQFSKKAPEVVYKRLIKNIQKQDNYSQQRQESKSQESKSQESKSQESKSQESKSQESKSQESQQSQENQKTQNQLTYVY